MSSLTVHSIQKKQHKKVPETDIYTERKPHKYNMIVVCILGLVCWYFEYTIPCIGHTHVPGGVGIGIHHVDSYYYGRPLYDGQRHNRTDIDGMDGVGSNTHDDEDHVAEQQALPVVAVGVQDVPNEHRRRGASRGGEHIAEHRDPVVVS